MFMSECNFIASKIYPRFVHPGSIFSSLQLLFTPQLSKVLNILMYFVILYSAHTPSGIQKKKSLLICYLLVSIDFTVYFNTFRNNYSNWVHTHVITAYYSLTIVWEFFLPVIQLVSLRNKISACWNQQNCCQGDSGRIPGQLFCMM